MLMPVRTESWTWPSLHPFFQVSLPEGFLLAVLKDELGPHLGAGPLDLLAVVGKNTIGRVQVAPTDSLAASPLSFELASLLHGDNSPEAFLSLVRTYATSGVSGVVPKFLTPATQALFRKASVATERFIIKGSSDKLPFVALNEHLCMEVARRTGYLAPHTQVSDDGQALIVERFDVDPATGERLGFEDVCSLLGLPPEDKYQSTWERVARLAREWVSDQSLRQAQEQLAITLLLTYALGNADCHTKNLGLLYTSTEDVRLAPIYDMLSIRVYDGYVDNPPGMYIDGRKSWTPGKSLWWVLQQHMGIEPAQQRELADTVCDSAAKVLPDLIHHVKTTPGFNEVGSRMIWEWNDGMKRLSDRITVSVPDFVSIARAEDVEAPVPPTTDVASRVGESPLLGRRGRAKAVPAS